VPVTTAAETVIAPGSARDAVSAIARRVVAEFPPGTTLMRTFLGACFDAGLAWVHFPFGSGGLGVDAGLQAVADAVVQEAGGPALFDINPMAYGMAGPTIMAHGSAELRTRLLRRMYVCEDLWCQLFSEPGAGSDLAGLATTAERDGDSWRLNGQKVWTSLGHVAGWAMVLARSDISARKHRGMTYFVMDMTTPGVEVRPLRQMTGESEFNQIFLSDVVIPDHQRLGEVGEGWRVAMTTLMNERNTMGSGSSVRNSGPIQVPMRLWADRPDLRTPALQDRLIALFSRAEAQRLMGDRQRVERGDKPIGPEGSAAKLLWAELGQDIFAFCMDLLGPEATRYEGYDIRREPRDLGDGVLRWGKRLEEERDIQRMFLRSRAYTIEGGTSDVLRNIIGERILGLPGDPRVDLDRPWNEIPRG
jgi:alkylation response protein AidB-like acyl-CoA dehydrogenase